MKNKNFLTLTTLVFILAFSVMALINLSFVLKQLTQEPSHYGNFLCRVIISAALAVSSLISVILYVLPLSIRHQSTLELNINLSFVGVIEVLSASYLLNNLSDTSPLYQKNIARLVLVIIALILLAFGLLFKIGKFDVICGLIATLLLTVERFIHLAPTFEITSAPDAFYLIVVALAISSYLSVGIKNRES